MLFLIGEAMKLKEVEYLHMISEHDFPIKSPSQISQFLTMNRGKEFIEYFELPSDKWIDGGLSRIEQYHFYDLLDAKKSSDKWILTWLNGLQRKFGVKRSIRSDFPKLFGGSTWWTLSAESLRYVLNYLETHPRFFNRFTFTFCAEEIIFPTIIMNSPFVSRVVNDPLRFIVWERRSGNLPANLDEKDLSAIMNSTSLFARRFEYPVSAGLRTKIMEWLKMKAT